jgi:photosystem II reaction center protein PsbP
MQRERNRQVGAGIVALLLAAVIMAALAAIGVFVWQQYRTDATKSAASQHTKSPTKHDVYVDWKTYTSTSEKLSFRYPSDWQAAPFDSYGDALTLKSPSGNTTLTWRSIVTGIGGACDTTIMPGTSIATDALGPCPYWYVLEEQKLTGADLYYVAGVETPDGATYLPWCALQSADGILESRSSIGYMLFNAKNNDFQANGHDYGRQPSAFQCNTSLNGFGSLGIRDLPTITKAQATALLSTPEFQQAKMILLSASY